MFNFFKQKKTYKKIDLGLILGYKIPNTIHNPVERNLKLNDIIITQNSQFLGDYFVEINDNGVKGYISLLNKYYQHDFYNMDFHREKNEILSSKYGYRVECFGKYFFFNNIIDCLYKYTEEEEKYYTKKIQAANLGPPIYNPSIGYPNSQSYFSNIEPFRITTINKTDFKIRIVSNNNEHLIVDTIGGLNPIYFGEDILSHNGSLYFYEPMYGFNYPRISYGAYYSDAENNIKYEISENLLSFKRINIDVARVEDKPYGPRSPIMVIKNRSRSSLYNWDKIFLYKDDIVTYNNYDEYQLQNKSMVRDKKLDTLLGD